MQVRKTTRTAGWGLGILGLVSGILLGGTASAQWSDDFDSYAAGTTVIGQGDWEGWDNLSTVDADVTDARAASAPNSLELRGNSDVVKVLRGVDSGRWRIRARVFVPANHRGGSWFILLNRYSHNGAKNWSSQIRIASGRIQFHDGDGNELGVSRAVAADTWSEIRVDIDLERNLQAAFLDDAPLIGFPFPWETSGIGEIQCIDLWSDGGSGALYDNVSLEPIAETDCNGNGTADSEDLATGASADCNGNLVPDECDIESGYSPDDDGDGVPDDCLGGFRRGDANVDGIVDISDAIFILGYLFLGTTSPACVSAAEANGDGNVDLSDSVMVLNFLFLGGSPPPAPGPFECGPGSGPADCDSYDAC